MQAVILNDSAPDNAHFGCIRVMRAIREGLTSRGVEIIAQVPHATDWKADPRHMAALRRADLIVVNGEGTLHHGGTKARWLLEAVEVAATTGARTALVNALWQDNPPEFAALAARFDHLWCRDSRSAAALGAATGRKVAWFGDLSICVDPAADGTVRGDTITLGDSVKGAVTRHLASLAAPLSQRNATVTVVPVVNRLKLVNPALTGVRRAMRTAYADWRHRRFLRSHPKVAFAPDEATYLATLRRSRLSVTGRFHAACIAAVTETPFLAVGSNSWKIETLVADIGLSSDRIVPLDRLDADLILGRNWDYSTEETERLRQFVGWSRASANAMWDSIATP